MKKLIIVDVDDEMYTHAKVSLSYKDDDGYWADVNYETLPLRPMPLKRETMVHWKGMGGMKVLTDQPTEYDKGWNDCIDLLEGDCQDD